uniref:Plasma membrane proteolipid 3 n=1 Tax=Onchocerca volvulus TaxID=6282 RepID=A0A8R1TQ63_ONCVO
MLLILIIFIPIGVFFEKGCGVDLAINILLTLLGYIPGLIHACFIIVRY